MGLTMAHAHAASDPPPDVGSLGLAPMALGAGILLLGGALTAGGVAVLGDARRSRWPRNPVHRRCGAGGRGHRPRHSQPPARRGPGHRPDGRRPRLRRRSHPPAPPAPLRPRNHGAVARRTLLVAAPWCGSCWHAWASPSRSPAVPRSLDACRRSPSTPMPSAASWPSWRQAPWWLLWPTPGSPSRSGARCPLGAERRRPACIGPGGHLPRPGGNGRGERGARGCIGVDPLRRDGGRPRSCRCLWADGGPPGGRAQVRIAWVGGSAAIVPPSEGGGGSCYAPPPRVTPRGPVV